MKWIWREDTADNNTAQRVLPRRINPLRLCPSIVLYSPTNDLLPRDILQKRPLSDPYVIFKKANAPPHSFQLSPLLRPSMASSSLELSSTETPKLEEASRGSSSCFFLLSVANYLTPPLHPILRPISRPNLGLLPELFQKSLVSAAERCFRALRSFVAENPFLGRVHSLQSEFENVCRQVILLPPARSAKTPEIWRTSTYELKQKPGFMEAGKDASILHLA